ncbi:MAG: hypothetical protein FWC39_10600 [Bacteroidetes bacterium]|nr:hypothetical protein [Bacteroidota bacterium]
MKKLIVLDDKKVRAGIVKAFRCTDPCVSQSLNFKRNGLNNQKIRLSAMNSGGILMQEVTNWKVADIK